MRVINAITQDAIQQFTLVSETGENINFSLRYLARQQQWIFDIAFGEVTIKGVVLTVSPNVLRNYKNLIDFGLMCTSTDGQDPWYITDFVTQPPANAPRIDLFLLNAADVAAVERTYFS